jgi:hypothetical protein
MKYFIITSILIIFTFSPFYIYLLSDNFVWAEMGFLNLGVGFVIFVTILFKKIIDV